MVGVGQTIRPNQKILCNSSFAIALELPKSNSDIINLHSRQAEFLRITNRIGTIVREDHFLIKEDLRKVRVFKEIASLIKMDENKLSETLRKANRHDQVMTILILEAFRPGLLLYRLSPAIDMGAAFQIVDLIHDNFRLTSVDNLTEKEKAIARYLAFKVLYGPDQINTTGDQYRGLINICKIPRLPGSPIQPAIIRVDPEHIPAEFN